MPEFRERSRPRLTAGSRSYEVRTLRFSSGGSLAGTVRAVGLGCSPEAFAPLRRGEVALIERGTCSFRAKSLAAQRAGAAAVLIADAEPVRGSLQRAGVRVPVLAVGADAAGLAGTRVRVAVDAQTTVRRSPNVIGELGRRGGGSRRDGRRPPRLRARRPRPQRQRQRRRRGARDRRGARRAPSPGQHGAAVRVLGRRGDRPRRLTSIRRATVPRRARAHRGLHQPRHGRLAGRRARGLRRRPRRSKRPCAATSTKTRRAATSATAPITPRSATRTSPSAASSPASTTATTSAATRSTTSTARC